MIVIPPEDRDVVAVFQEGSTYIKVPVAAWHDFSPYVYFNQGLKAACLIHGFLGIEGADLYENRRVQALHSSEALRSALKGERTGI